jgi:hypothetical protein
MPFLTDEEGSISLRALTGFLISHPRLLPVGDDRLYADLPVTSGKKNFLAEVISRDVKFPCLLWFDELDVWDEQSNWPMADLIRKGLGENRPWYEASVIVCNSGEQDLVRALTGLAMHNLWDLWLVEPQRKRVWHITHDEGILLYGDSVVLDEYREFFASL